MGSPVGLCPNGQTLTGTELSGVVYLWRGATLDEVRVLRGHKSTVRALTYHPDSHILATGGDDGYVILWDFRSGTQLHALAGHKNHVRTIAFDHSGHYLASGGHGNTIRLWDVDSGRLLNTIPQVTVDAIDGLAFSPRANLLAYGDTNNHLNLYDLAKGRVVARVLIPSRSNALAFSPNSLQLACGTFEGSVLI